MVGMPHRLQITSASTHPALLDLPWQVPLEDWPQDRLAALPRGLSRHVVRFVRLTGTVIAVKEIGEDLARREYGLLRLLRRIGLPAVEPVGVVTGRAAPDGTPLDPALITRHLQFSLPYRALFSQILRADTGTRLVDALAVLLVRLHLAGFYWGDCSLANTLFRRDGDKIQAYLVDAETSEIHPSLSDGQRAFDLEILVENVGFGLADLGAMQGRTDAFEDAVEAAETVRSRYESVWEELHLVPELSPDDRHAVRARIRHLNDLGFAVDEIELEPAGPDGGSVRLRVAVTNRRFHARELERLTGIVALEGQARLLLNDLREYRAWLEYHGKRFVGEEEAAALWLVDVLQPSLAVLVPAIGEGRDPIQAYCDVLEQKWILSELAAHDVGLDAAMDAYLSLGAPAPEDDRGPTGNSLALDIDWSTTLDRTDPAAVTES